MYGYSVKEIEFEAIDHNTTIQTRYEPGAIYSVSRAFTATSRLRDLCPIAY